jgi:hypothetical protein
VRDDVAISAPIRPRRELGRVYPVQVLFAAVLNLAAVVVHTDSTTFVCIPFSHFHGCRTGLELFTESESQSRLLPHSDGQGGPSVRLLRPAC